MPATIAADSMAPKSVSEYPQCAKSIHDHFWNCLHSHYRKTVEFAKFGIKHLNVSALLALIVLAGSKAFNKNTTDGLAVGCEGKPVEDWLFVIWMWRETRQCDTGNNCLQGRKWSHTCPNTGNTWLFTGSVWWRNAVYIWIPVANDGFSWSFGF